MTIEDIHSGLANLINQYIKQEHSAQGHYLTGSLEGSLENKLIKFAKSDILAGFAIYYAKVIEEGLEPDRVSFKMLPGLTKYFILRGYGPQEAKRIAGATINKWKTEGLSTQASKRFSKTGSRHHFVEATFIGKSVEMDNYMGSNFDFAVDEQYNKTKSETA